MLIRVLTDQQNALRFVLSSSRVLVPAMVRWVERFGGGLGSPVKPFFMLALSLSPIQMGMLSTVSVFFALIPAPLYGFVQDRFGTYFPIIVASTACGLGCTLEGLATGFNSLVAARVFQGIGGDNLPSVINAHLSACAPPSKRALVLSAFSFQCMVLRLGGQLFYTPWDVMLRALSLDRMLRFRITLSVCSLFCWFGVVALLVAGRQLRQPQSAVGPIEMVDDDGEERAATTTASTEDKSGRAAATASSADPNDAATADLSVGTALGRILPSVLLLATVTTYEALLQTIWPLFMHEHYGWSEQQYASLIFTSTVTQAAFVGLYPRLHAIAGDSLSVLLVAGALGGGAMVAMSLTAPRLADGHVALMLIANGCVAALGPAVMALASTLVPSVFLGRLFATMNIFNALGRSVAGLVGTRLYELSVALPPSGGADGGGLGGGHGGGHVTEDQPTAWLAALGPLARGGALPTTLLAPLLLGVAVVVHATTTLAKRGGRRTELV